MDLIDEYAQLKSLQDMSAQARGQRFNGLVANLLRAHGIPAETSIRRPHGEVDVVFTLDGVRHVLEAKWEKDKTNPAKIYALRGQVEARLADTRGVFLSMSGYSAEAHRRRGE